MSKIVKIVGREILNGKGKPTVEAELLTDDGIIVFASVPSGTSRGKYEAHELYDGEKRYGGYGTRKAAKNISTIINDALVGMDVTLQGEIDRKLCELDGTPNKERLGGNAILAVSVAVARAGARASKLPLYQYLNREKSSFKMPDILATVIAGGVFSTSGMEFEDYMMALSGFDNFPDELEALSSMRMLLEKKLKKQYGDFPEDGGALAAPCTSSQEAFQWIIQTAEELGYENNVSIAVDVAASELLNHETKKYNLNNGRFLTREELIDYYIKLVHTFPISYIEDGFDQDDFEAFHLLKSQIPEIQIVGDDLFATNVNRLKEGIEKDSANAILLKINQIGTVSEALETSKIAMEQGYDVIVSLRSGETNDDFIADLAVAIGAKQIKLGSPVRAERNAKYNRLLRIYEEIK